MKSIEKIKAIKLRQTGMSVRNIAKQLDVSKGTVSRWVGHIELTQDQKEVLRANNPIYNNQYKGAASMQTLWRERRLKYREEGKIQARKNEVLHSLGCALYWGEGHKHRTTCSMANSDPNLHKTFLRFIHTYFPDAHIKARVQCFTNNGLSVNDIEQYWSDVLNIPRSNFRKGTTNIVSSASKGKRPINILPYGTLTVRVGGVQMVQHIFGAIEEYGLFSSTMGLD